MKKVNHFASSKRILALAALATGVALPPQQALATRITQVVEYSGSVKGQVVDDKGEPVIGATVKVKGDAKNGTVTDIDGNFTLRVAPGTELEFSYVGYKSQVVKAGTSPLKVVLKKNAQNMNEVVVVGFGTQKKVNLTGWWPLPQPRTLSHDPCRTLCRHCKAWFPD